MKYFYQKIAVLNPLSKNGSFLIFFVYLFSSALMTCQASLLKSKPTGVQVLRGLKGATGATGAKGDKGDKGDNGDPGWGPSLGSGATTTSTIPSNSTSTVGSNSPVTTTNTTTNTTANTTNNTLTNISNITVNGNGNTITVAAQKPKRALQERYAGCNLWGDSYQGSLWS